jgi:hypothetical protein
MADIIANDAYDGFSLIDRLTRAREARTYVSIYGNPSYAIREPVIRVIRDEARRHAPVEMPCFRRCRSVGERPRHTEAIGGRSAA